MSVLYKMKEFFGFAEEEMDLDDFKSLIDEEQTEKQPVEKPQNNNLRPFKGSLVNTQNARPFPVAEIKVEEPRIYEDSLNIATMLRENRPVIVNLKYLDNPSGKRLIDFVCGTAYAINGHMMKIGENIFLFTPANILISDSNEKNQEPVMEKEIVS